MKKIMNFQTFSLNEAQSFSPEELKDRIKKDNRVSMILKKGVKFEDIKNPEEFMLTMKNLMLSNKQIIDYARKTKQFDDYSWDFDTLRKMKPSEFDENTFYTMVELVHNLTKQADRTKKQMVLGSTKKEIEDWINTSTGRRFLSRDVVAELDSIPGLKPSKPVKLYRGLLWSDFSMRKDKPGHKFMESIRKDSDIVDYTIDKIESWTYSIDVADKFAMNGPANSEYSAMMNWLYQQKAHAFIQGELGVIISILAKPEDILADLSKVANKLNTTYEWEDEVILKPGKYVAKIVSMYDKKGEITPQEFIKRISEDSNPEKSKNITELLNTAYELEPTFKKFTGGYMRMDREFFDVKNMKPMLDNKDDILAAFDRIFKMYKNLGTDREGLNPTMDRAMRQIITVSPTMGERSTLKTIKDFETSGEFFDAMVQARLSKIKSVLNDYLKRSGRIKRDMSFYKQETLAPIVSKLMDEINTAAGSGTGDKDALKTVATSIALESLVSLVKRLADIKLE